MFNRQAVLSTVNSSQDELAGPPKVSSSLYRAEHLKQLRCAKVVVGSRQRGHGKGRKRESVGIDKHSIRASSLRFYESAEALSEVFQKKFRTF
jgi:hypothetical protein